MDGVQVHEDRLRRMDADSCSAVDGFPHLEARTHRGAISPSGFEVADPGKELTNPVPLVKV